MNLNSLWHRSDLHRPRLIIVTITWIYYSIIESITWIFHKASNCHLCKSIYNRYISGQKIEFHPPSTHTPSFVMRDLCIFLSFILYYFLSLISIPWDSSPIINGWEHNQFFITFKTVFNLDCLCFSCILYQKYENDRNKQLPPSIIRSLRL